LVGLETATVTAELSNPALSISNSNTPPFLSSPSLNTSRRSSSGQSSVHHLSADRSSNKRKRGLTHGDHEQNIPPQTQRALSSESWAGPAANHGKSSIANAVKMSRSSSSTSNHTPGSHVSGQLTVSIVEGRGLRPSHAPYVVCIFQLSEAISEGAKADAMDTKADTHVEESSIRGVAMRRLNSESGRSISGLRSRQSSMTDIAKLKNSTKDERVTDPSWKHEAILYVDTTRRVVFSLIY